MTPVPDWSAVIDATWPAAHVSRHGPWVLRHTPGGGRRVNATTASERVTGAQVAKVTATMPHAPFRLHGAPDLDKLLADAGYLDKDATAIMAAPAAALLQPVPGVTAFTVWPPLAVQRDIWAVGGIGPARLAIMDRVTGPRTALLGRIDDRPAGCAFVALHQHTAMLHALEVAVPHRRRGLGRHLTVAAARWAAAQGAVTFSLLVTVANADAGGLYASLGLQQVGCYHYRCPPEEAS
ncbi:Acetyltransferase (GNAT) family protein [Loktanella fryxellensis]|uniref:Acetyltransferase (GNAT) family protein n=1 Tax=Loktanella fryxellensis TaxID=245187 RepID=A0A1H8FMJ0_9RHOB|nr:GNAT family N-acetyltransferase [Loktanella fryxellensis]SEN32810.1 Acetyltransferase (GNAT) family protein [Loktanella fryxellensis]